MAGNLGLTRGVVGRLPTGDVMGVTLEDAAGDTANAGDAVPLGVGVIAEETAC